MAPLLIDNRGLVKLGFISVLTAAFVFVAGFLLGHQRATTFYQAGSELASLSLPEKVASLENELEPQTPEIIEAGADIDVDHPGARTKTTKKVITKASIKVPGSDGSKKASNYAVDVKPLFTKTRIAKHQSSSSNVDVKVSNNIAPDDVKSTSEKGNNLAAKGNASSSERQNQNAFIITKKIQPSLPISFTSDALNKIKYTIQVGMYGRLANAENMMEMLRKQHLDAYVSDYTNKENETRYNVRFGYFVDKKTAISALKKYRNNQQGDGYLVKFTAKDISNVAAAENIEQPATIIKTLKKLTPEKSPVEVLHDNISQDNVSHADILNISNTATN